jgi:glycogen(starch) synthase
MGLRILHVLDHSLPLHSGYTFRTLAILREQRSLGWETVQLTSPKQGPGDARSEEVDGWHFLRTPSAAGTGHLAQMWLTSRRLRDVAREVRPDLIHAHSPVLNALPSLWVGRARRIPVVYEMRASWEDAAVDHGTTTEGSTRYRISRALESFALRHADHVTTICDGLRRDIEARGIAPQRVTVVPNAVDTQSFRFGTEADPQLRRELGLDGATVVGFAGSFYGYEGLDLLLRAVQRLLDRHPTLRVLLVGGGPQEPNLQALARALRIWNRVVFVGRVPQNQVQRYYDLIDVLAYPRLPIRLTEMVTPLKPLEAMAQGRIVVASDVGGHRELIRHGDTGYLFAAGDAQALEQSLDEALARRDAWPGMRANGRRFVEAERTWRGSVARYRDAYREALARYGRAEPALC